MLFFARRTKNLGLCFRKVALMQLTTIFGSFTSFYGPGVITWKQSQSYRNYGSRWECPMTIKVLLNEVYGRLFHFWPLDGFSLWLTDYFCSMMRTFWIDWEWNAIFSSWQLSPFLAPCTTFILTKSPYK